MRTAIISIVGVVAFFLVIQLVPYGHNHTNPPVAQEPDWPDQETRALAQRTCYDCHSDETTWVWYTNVAPISWLIQRDVDGGRRELNFSQWATRQRHIREAAREVQNGSMPPWYYIPLHPGANLRADEKAKLIQGLQAIGSASPTAGDRGEEGESR